MRSTHHIMCWESALSSDNQHIRWTCLSLMRSDWQMSSDCSDHPCLSLFLRTCCLCLLFRWPCPWKSTADWRSVQHRTSPKALCTVWYACLGWLALFLWLPCRLLGTYWWAQELPSWISHHWYGWPLCHRACRSWSDIRGPGQIQLSWKHLLQRQWRHSHQLSPVTLMMYRIESISSCSSSSSDALIFYALCSPRQSPQLLRCCLPGPWQASDDT